MLISDMLISDCINHLQVSLLCRRVTFHVRFYFRTRVNTILKLSIFFFAAFIPAKTLAQVAVDTFSIDGVLFEISPDSNWITEELNSGVANDSSWNYVRHYTIDQREVNGRIGIQIVNNTKSQNEKGKKKIKFTFEEKSYGNRWGYEIIYLPKPVKSCRTCGYSYLNVFVTPVSDCKSLYIVFSGNGPKTAMDSLVFAYRSFCEKFLNENATPLNKLLIPFSLPSHTATSTFYLDSVPVNLIYNLDWTLTVDSMTRTFELQQYYGCQHNALIQFWFQDIGLKQLKKSPKVELDPMNRNKNKIARPLPITNDTVTSVFWDPTIVHSARTEIIDQSDPDDDKFWMDIVVSATQKVNHPLLINRGLTIQLSIRIQDPIYVFYYENVVNYLMKEIIELNHWGESVSSIRFDGTPQPYDKRYVVKEPTFGIVTRKHSFKPAN